MESRSNLIPSKNSALERFILLFKYFHRFSIASRIRSVGMLVNRETTSKETNSKPSETVILSTISFSSVLFFYSRFRAAEMFIKKDRETFIEAVCWTANY